MGNKNIETIIDQNREWIDTTWDKVDTKLRRVAVKNRNRIPYTSINGEHDDKSQTNVTLWTNGFWGGMMWLMYLSTGNEEYRKTAERNEEMLDEAFRQVRKLHHDVGFMWHLTSGANYRITGNEDSFVRNYLAATTLFSRYNIDGDYIRAWNNDWAGSSNAGFSIIDCLMNLPILYWASEEVQDDRFKKVAMRQMEMTMRDHIREDGSVNHIVDHEINKPGVVRVLGGQGYDERSCWSRGLAWAVYGSVISFIHVGKQEYLESAKRTARYFIEHVKETDFLPVIDFCAPKEPIYYDSTAGVCAACGLLEIASCVSEEESEYYADAAISMLKACDAHFCNYEENEDALVMMGSERYPHDENEKKGLHIPIIYGDFFFVEALTKLRKSKFFIW